MHCVYIDESGSVYANYANFRAGYARARAQAQASGPPYPRYPFFILAAMGLPESHISVVDEWFDRVKIGFLGASPGATGREYEIKGSVLYALRRGKVPAEWSSATDKKRAGVQAQRAIWQHLSEHSLQQLEDSVFDLLRRLSPTVWVVVVKQAHAYDKYKSKTWHPFYWALTYLQQRVVHHVQVRHGGYERAMFVMDENSTLSTASHFDSFLTTRAAINATTSWPVDFSRYIVDIPFRGSSHLHQAIQLVDFVAHTVYRHVRKDDPLDWFTRIEPFLAQHWKSGSYSNAGLAFIG